MIYSLKIQKYLLGSTKEEVVKEAAYWVFWYVSERGNLFKVPNALDAVSDF